MGVRREQEAQEYALLRIPVMTIGFQADCREDNTGLGIACMNNEQDRCILDYKVEVTICGDDFLEILERFSAVHGLPAILRKESKPELTW